MTTIEEQPRSVEQYSRSYKRARKTKAAAGIAGLGLIGAVVAELFSGGGAGSIIDHPGKVVKIEAVAFDCRARTTSEVSATANYTTQPVGRIGKSWLGRDIGLHWAEGKVAKTFNSAVTFSAPVDTLSCIAADKQHITQNKDGSTSITINNQDIQFYTNPELAANEFSADEGIMADVGSAAWSVINNPEKSKIQRIQGNLVSYAAEAAVNFAQETCASKAWPQTEQAFTYGEDEVAKGQLLAADPKLKNYTNPQWTELLAKTVHVVFDGPPPSFPAVYKLPSNYPVTRVGGGECTIAPNSLVQPNYVNPSTGDAATLTVGN